MNQSQTLETVIALLGLIKKAGTGTQFFQLDIFLKHQQIILQKRQIPVRIDSVNPWENHGNIGVIFPESVFIADFSVPVYMKCKGQLPAFRRIGGEAFVKGSEPDLISAVLAYNSHIMKQLQILFVDGEGCFNADGLKLFVEIRLLNRIITADSADGIQNGGFSCIVFSYQNQSAVNVGNFHVANGFEVMDVQISKLHKHLLKINKIRLQISPV